MRAIILCPGPSLNRYTPRTADLYIAVNDAAAKFPCHIWAAMDRPFISDHAGKTHGLTLLTLKETAKSIRKRNQWAGEFEILEDCESSNPPIGWRLYTAPAACVWAVVNGYETIDVYGCDLMGTQYATGRVELPRNVSERRWESEREAWKQITAWAAYRGASVNIVKL